VAGDRIRHAPRARHARRIGRPRDSGDTVRRALRRCPRGPARRYRVSCRGDLAAHRHPRRHPAMTEHFVLVHADESCLGNDSTKRRRGGNAALIEAPAGDSVARWDFFECSPQTTNNKMALAGAIAALEWIRRQWRHALVHFVSDSEYLVKGMSEW